MSVIVSIVQHYTIGTLFLIDRTAIFLLILFNLVLIFFINKLFKKKLITTLLSGSLALIVLFHFILSFNIHYVLEWKLDSDIKQMVSDLEKVKLIPKEKNNISISIPLEFDQGINFYRAKNNLTWANTVERSDKGDMRYDYFFIRDDEQKQFNNDSLTIIKVYPETNNILAKRRYQPKQTLAVLKDSIGFKSLVQNEFMLNDQTEYAPGFDYKLTDSMIAEKNAEVVVEASVMAKNSLKKDCYLVISFENETGLYLWKKVSIKDYVHINDTWTKVYFSCLVPEQVKSGDKLKSYIWNPNRQELFIKEMKLKWLVYKN